MVEEEHKEVPDDSDFQNLDGLIGGAIGVSHDGPAVDSAED